MGAGRPITTLLIQRPDFTARESKYRAAHSPKSQARRQARCVSGSSDPLLCLFQYTLHFELFYDKSFSISYIFLSPRDQDAVFLLVLDRIPVLCYTETQEVETVLYLLIALFLTGCAAGITALKISIQTTKTRPAARSPDGVAEKRLRIARSSAALRKCSPSTSATGSLLGSCAATRPS